jgi:VWFA-related protein
LDRQEARLHVIRRSEGAYGDRERLELSLDALRQFARHEAETPGRKLLVWVSPGWPLLDDPGLEMTSKAEEWVFENIVSLSDALRWARITLYAVDPLGTGDAGRLRTSAYKAYLKGVKKASQALPGNLALQVLANQSGGLVLNSSNDLEGQIAKCVADASSFYVLTFDALPGDGPNEYHALEVRIGKAGLTARARSGYYAQPR